VPSFWSGSSWGWISAVERGLCPPPRRTASGPSGSQRQVTRRRPRARQSRPKRGIERRGPCRRRRGPWSATSFRSSRCRRTISRSIQSASMFCGGAIADNAGAFVQTAYNQYGDKGGQGDEPQLMRAHRALRPASAKQESVFSTTAESIECVRLGQTPATWGANSLPSPLGHSVLVRSAFGAPRRSRFGGPSS
jgi:hypothetical protein